MGSLRHFVLDTLAGQSFMESEIWNGPIIRQEIENAYRCTNPARVERAWPYVHAARLTSVLRASPGQVG